MSTRPGGLTALAILNLIFGVLSAFSCLFGLAAIFFVQKVSENLPDENGEKIPNIKEIIEETGGSMDFIYIALLISLVGAVLMFIAGIGYLGQKKFLGRTLGLAYGALSLVGTALALGFGQSFGITSMISLIYPLVTIVLLLTVFRDDFIH